MKRKLNKLTSLVFLFPVLITITVFLLSDICSAKGMVIPNFQPPKKEDVVWMESFSVADLQINFLERSRAGVLVGRIIGLKEVTDIDIVKYTVKSPAGAIYWEKTVSGSSFDERNGASFELLLEGVRLSKGSILYVEVFDEKGTLLASGEQTVALQLFFVGPEVSDLVVTIKEGKGVASFVLSNSSTESVTLFPSVEVLNRDESKSFGVFGGEEVLVKGELKGVIKEDLVINFDLPKDPQVYVLKLFVAKEKGGESLGGVIKKNFLIKGVFARVKLFKLLKEELKAKTANFVFAGLTNSTEGVEVSMEVIQKWEGSVVDRFEKVITVPVEKGGAFNGNMEFDLTVDADSFVADVFIKQKGGRIIGERHLEEVLFVAPKLQDIIIEQKEEQVLDEKIEKAKWWMRKDWLVWGIVLLVLVLFATNNWLRLHKKFLGMFMLSLLLFNLAMAVDTTGSVAPSVWWKHPVESWYFNPNPESSGFITAGFEHFAKVRMRGSILSGLTDDTDPLFAGDVKPTPIVVVNLKKDSVDKWIGLNPGDNLHNFNDITGEYLSIEDSVRFEFEVNTHDDTDLNGDAIKDFLVDGTWEYVMYICMGGVINGGDVCSGGQWYASTPRDIKVDSMRPILTMEHDADPLQDDLHSTRIGINQASLDTKTVERDVKFVEKRVAEDLKDEKELEKALAEGSKMEKTRQQLDATARIGIVTARMDRIINHDLVDPYIPQAEKDKLYEKLYGLELGIPDETPGDNTGGLEEDLFDLTTERDGLIAQITTLDGEIVAAAGIISTKEGEITTIDGQITTIEGEIDTFQTNINDIKRMSKNDFVTLDIDCDDGANGSECRAASYLAEVKGNFCPNGICDTMGAKKIKICDKVGNCTDPDMYLNAIDWYDVVSPEATITLKNDINEDGVIDTDMVGSDLKAGNLITFALSATADLRRDDNSTTGPTLSYDYNADACGANANAPLFAATADICLERKVVCASQVPGEGAVKRGEQELDNGGVCTSECEPGYIYDNGICYLDCDQRNLEICLPGILGRGNCPAVEFDAWAPDPATQPSGIPFMQENGCGNRRQVLGTDLGTCLDINRFGCAPFTGEASFQ